ncbi:MAG: DUF4190 domain-containing protein [Archangiaceae bacterium]|nr:DUF4190 domain-containing protein [Archangiaceae bacterium]
MADTPPCPAHAGEVSLGACARCGTFVCGLDSREVERARYCLTCAARPDVDWLEAFRSKHWGVRDGWAWLFGIAAVPQAGLGAVMMRYPDSRVLGALVLAAAAGGALWCFKVRQARWLLVAVSVGQTGFLAMTVHPVWLLGGAVPLAILLSVVLATRTRLFFELPVTRDQLNVLWDLYANNQVARYALTLGVAGLLVWPLAPFALVCGAIGLARVDLQARPPIGRKGTAIAGMVLGVLGIAICATAILVGNFR